MTVLNENYINLKKIILKGLTIQRTNAIKNGFVKEISRAVFCISNKLLIAYVKDGFTTRRHFLVKKKHSYEFNIWGGASKIQTTHILFLWYRYIDDNLSLFSNVFFITLTHTFNRNIVDDEEMNR